MNSFGPQGNCKDFKHWGGRSYLFELVHNWIRKLNIANRPVNTKPGGNYVIALNEYTQIRMVPQL